MGEIKWLRNELSGGDCSALRLMSVAESKRSMGLHQSFPDYAKTPLVSLGSLAKELGVGGIYVKDESTRFGLNAFKALGGSYAIAKHLAMRLGKETLDFDELAAAKDTLGEISFYTATDGNHGRGVAWAARRFGHKAFVYMPDGTTLNRRDNIRKEGAYCEIIEGFNYDACVRLAASEALKSGGVVVQDTSWAGYEEIPGHVMQGYGTMGLEIARDFEELGVWPTHMFLQSGVGSMPAAILAFFKNYAPDKCPITTIVEPHSANCFYKSARSGKLEIVTGDLFSIMAGLACGEPNPVAWEMLKGYAEFFMSCSDEFTKRGMRRLAAPLGSDKKIVSGESGAVGIGLLEAIMTDEKYRDFRDALGLLEESRVLFFSTEGATDPDMYEEIVNG